MPLSDKLFVDKINSCLIGSLSSIENAQMVYSTKKLSTNLVESVATFAALPVASENTGRMIYVDSADTYYFSNGETWTKDLTSNFVLRLWAWGRGSNGRLGDNTQNNISSPVSVVGGFTDWCQVSAGGSHTAAVRQNGTLWTWGSNTLGGLGDGTTTNKSSPVLVSGGFTDWCQVSAGDSHTAAIRTNGTLWTWGSQGINSSGQLGDGTTVEKSSPVSVIGGFTDWCQVAAGLSHTAAVRTNGTLWTWGWNCRGILGDGTTVAKCSPVSVVGGFTDWCQVSVGCYISAAVRTNGTIWTWGAANNGMLGDGTTVDKSSPVSVIGGFTDWCQVSTGVFHTVAVRQNGTLWAWGRASYGVLGDNNDSFFRTSPVSVVGGFTDWCQVSAGDSHTAAIRTNGTLWAWGCNNQGRLGDGTTVAKCSPVSVIGGFTDWCQVEAGGEHTAAIVYQKGF